MRLHSPVLPPSFCDESTDLYHYVEELISRSQRENNQHFLSVTIETDYSDPLAVLETIHQNSVPICYLEKPGNEFSIAAGEYLSVSRFSGTQRFQKAQTWADDIFSKTVVAGDHKIAELVPLSFCQLLLKTITTTRACLHHWKSSYPSGKYFERRL